MSTAIAKNFQVGSDGTATNNFTIRQPATPDGTVRIANGNSGTTTDLVTVTSAGNVGVGVTPSAWASQPAIQQTGGALWGINAANYEVLQNAFYNGTNYIYRNTNLASRYNQNAGVHSWFTAPSGTAGNAISFTQAMTLDASGNLGVGTSTPADKLDVAITAAAPSNSNFLGITVGPTSGSTAVGEGVGIGFRIRNTAGGAIGGNGFGAAIYGVQTNTAANTGGLAFYTRSDASTFSERLRLDSSGNLGLGVTPSAWQSGRVAFQIQRASAGGGVSIHTAATSQAIFAANTYYNGTNDIYTSSGAASSYVQFNGAHSWYTAPSGTAGNSISFTQAMTLDASGNLGINSTSPSTFGKVTVQVAGTTTPTNLTNVGPSSINLYAATNGGSTDSTMGIFGWNSTTGLGSGIGFSRENSGDWGTQIRFYTHPTTTSNIGDITERARITSGGDFLVGTTTAAQRLTVKGSAAGALSLVFNASSAVMVEVNGSNSINGVDGTPNANGLMRVWRDSGNLRSISAAGTINASGADYAEYMTKAGDFTVAKGDLVGINADGKLTNVFADAVSFVVKSTAPSYVGGDTWGAGLETDELETARQKVDRIAFAGQVPVNVTAAIAGQYIIPVNNNGAIKGEAVSNPTFEQYQIAVGKVIAIEQDGRARIIVKVA